MTETHCSQHLEWAELACHDEARTPYPEIWRQDRAVILAQNFELVRALLGNRPIVILSGYRTPEYNSKLEGAALHSQHVQGRAIDIAHPVLSAKEVYIRVLSAQRRGNLPDLGGLGLYKNFVHIDVRPKPVGRLAKWAGAGVVLPEVA